MKLYRIFVLCVPFLLAACDKKAEYIHLLHSPEQLKEKLATCDLDQQQKDSDSCLRAYATREAIAQFLDVQNEEAKKYPDAQAEFANYQQQVNQASTDPTIRDKIQAELAGVNEYYFTVAETYGQRIMQKQFQLEQFKAQGNLIQAKFTEMVIQAMLALVNINTGGAA